AAASRSADLAGVHVDGAGGTLWRRGGRAHPHAGRPGVRRQASRAEDAPRGSGPPGTFRRRISPDCGRQVMPTKRCPSPEQLEGLLEEQLDDTSCQAVAAHVDSCPHCQAALERLTEEDAEAGTALSSVRRLHGAESSQAARAASAPFLSQLK